MSKSRTPQGHQFCPVEKHTCMARVARFHFALGCMPCLYGGCLQVKNAFMFNPNNKGKDSEY